MKAGLLALFALVACSGDDAGDACDELGAALCARSAECGLIEPARIDWCAGEYAAACADRPELGDDQVVACAAALAGFDCDELAAGEQPPECEP